MCFPLQHDDATKGWKDIGVGQLSIRSKEGTERASKESTPTIVIRNDVCVLSCLFVVIEVHLSAVLYVLVLTSILVLHAKLKITTIFFFHLTLKRLTRFSKHMLLPSLSICC